MEPRRRGPQRAGAIPKKWAQWRWRPFSIIWRSSATWRGCACAASGPAATVLTRDEAQRVLAAVKPGVPGLIIPLLYGTGMRLLEALRLRVKVSPLLDLQ